MSSHQYSIHFSNPMYSPPTHHGYPSPHSSPSIGMEKPVINHNNQRWGSGSPQPPYHQMVSPPSVQWHNYEKQQRLPPTPPMPSQLEDYTFESIDGGFLSHGPPMGLPHNAPMTPPTSEGFMSPELTQQEQNQGWLPISSSPMLEMSGYNSAGHITGIRLQEHTPPLDVGRRRSAEEALYPDMPNSNQVPRKKRRLTEPNEANYHCSTCGKYFSRVWNYNAHRETHDPARPKPHVCTAPNCGKAFVRRTDLARHVQCVHDKAKKFKCSLCNNRFARKDTLRRHEDDGCPKRVDIQSRHSKGGAAQIAWTSWALRCPPPPEYFAYGNSAKPQDQQPQQVYDRAPIPSSYLPPLSAALSNGNQHMQPGHDVFLAKHALTPSLLSM